MLGSLFANALIHRTSQSLSRTRETHTASNLGEILDALAGLKSSQAPSPELKESQASPFYPVYRYTASELAA
jgi:hypothetical protein